MNQNINTLPFILFIIIPGKMKLKFDRSQQWSTYCFEKYRTGTKLFIL